MTHAATGSAAPLDGELAEWFDSLDDILHRHGDVGVQQLLSALQERAYIRGVTLPFKATTPYINTLTVDEQPPFPGNREIERRIKSIIRWNAMAMVVRANRDHKGIGGHISTYASSATLYEIGFNHFFHARTDDHTGDFVYFQGHASPGVYARAFLEGRLTENHLEHFREELPAGEGLSSYPHPWLMPDFWQFPTVLMGLGPITAIYQARFLRYLEHRGLADTSKSKVWCFVGDGEVDEPETLGALTLASREGLDNLIFVVNCNLQRLDGPVRGNGKIIQELEGAFRGAGWHCLKVIWGGNWEPLLQQDRDGELVQRMGEIVDGQYQKYVVEPGSYIREHFFGKSPKLQEMVASLSDEQLKKLQRGGHDPEKVFAAYKAAVEHHGSPTVILAKTIKGYGLGEAGEGRNVAHNVKKANEQELREFRSRFGIPIADDEVDQAPFYKPSPDSPEMQYLQERRKTLGGYLPARRPTDEKLAVPSAETFQGYIAKATEGSTTFCFTYLISGLLKDKQIGQRIVPIIPDEARTFGMEGLFRQCGIDRFVKLPLAGIDAALAEESLHAERACLIGNDRDDALADLLVLQQAADQIGEAKRRRAFGRFGDVTLESLGRGDRELFFGWSSRRQVTAQGFASVLQVLHLRAVGRRLVERSLVHLIVGNRNPEARAEFSQFLFVRLLDVVSDVASLARFAKPVAFDRLREDHCRRTAMLDCVLVGREHFFGIVSAPLQLLELLV